MKSKKTVEIAIILFIIAIFLLVACEIPKAEKEYPQETKEFQTETPIPDQQVVSADNDVPGIDSGKSVKNFDNALIVFTFDDGNKSDYVFAYSILRKFGIKGTSYINPYNPDHNVKNKLSWEQIKEMYAYGWDFEDHTYSHIDLTKSTSKQITQSIEKVDRAFTENGLKIPVAFAYPYGKFDRAAIDIIKQYRKQARLAFYSDSFVELNHMDPYQIPCVSADMQTEKRLMEKEKLIDKACEENAVIVFRVHCMYRNALDDMGKEVVQTSSKLFEKLVKYCVEKGCEFTTMDGLIGIYSNS